MAVRCQDCEMCQVPPAIPVGTAAKAQVPATATAAS